MTLSTILVPLDGSVIAEAALTPAVDLARTTGAKLVLLRAAEAHTGPLTDRIEAQVHVMREAEEYLAAVQARVKAAESTRGDFCTAAVGWRGVRPTSALIPAPEHQARVDPAEPK